MGKIDAATLASYGNTVYVRYVLQTLGEEQTTLQEKEFGSQYISSVWHAIRLLISMSSLIFCVS